MVERQLRPRGIPTPACWKRWSGFRESSSCATANASRAYDDDPLPIGYGQTISQPLMVALICQEAAVHPGQRVLDVGVGSGYQAAVLAELGADGPRGRAHPRARRLRPPRISSGRATPAASPFTRATARSDFPNRPRSTVSSSPQPPLARPETLYGQLVANGRLVVPVGARGTTSGSRSSSRARKARRRPHGSLPLRASRRGRGLSPGDGVGEPRDGTRARPGCLLPGRRAAEGVVSGRRGWVRNAADGSVGGGVRRRRRAGREHDRVVSPWPRGRPCRRRRGRRGKSRPGSGASPGLVARPDLSGPRTIREGSSGKGGTGPAPTARPAACPGL